MSEKFLYKISIRGMVQGVGFRWSAAKEAYSKGIKGFVRNEPGGSVFIEAEGTGEQLESFVEWCRKGPAFSLVESVDIETSPPVNYQDFRIIH